MPGVSKISADLHEHICRNWLGNAGQALAIKSESALELALISAVRASQSWARQLSGSAATRSNASMTRYFAPSLAMNNYVQPTPFS